MQHAALKNDRCKKILTDTLPGGTTNRPALVRLLKMLKAGDSLTVWKLDRLGRSLRDLITILDDMRARGVKFKSLTEAIDTETAAGRAMWQMIGIMAEFEHSLISERTQAGIAEAKRRGVKFGRKGILKDYQVEHTLQLMGQGETVTDIAASLRVGRATLYRAIAEYDRQHTKPLPLRARNSKKKHR